MPYFLIDGKSVYDKLRQPKFHWLVSSNAESDFQTFKTELERQYAELVDFSVISLHPEVTEAFGTDKPFNMLLRPDNYVGLISSETSRDEIDIYLKKLVADW
jgi:hypothetical protein